METTISRERFVWPARISLVEFNGFAAVAGIDDLLKAGSIGAVPGSRGLADLVNSTMRGGARAFLLVASRFVVGARTAAPTSVAVATDARIPKRLGLVRVLVSVLAFALASTGAAQPKVYDTGYETSRLVAGWPSLHWIDNNRLLFAGIKTADMDAAIAKKEANREERLKKLYLWDASMKSVKLYADAKGVCVANGIVRYTVRVDKAAGKAVVREGPFGSEKEVEKPLPSKEDLSPQGQMARVHSNLTCKTHLRSELSPSPEGDRNIVVLRDEHSYLDLGPSIGAGMERRRAFPRNLVLYQANSAKEIQLPMTWEEDFSPFGVAYSDYRGAYVLRPRAPRGATIGLSQPWPKNQPLVSYLLWPDGRTESVSIPYSPAEHLITPRPVKAGWIFGGGKSRQTTGLHLFDGKAVVKLDSGLVREIAVAADGCKAAIAIQHKFREMGAPTNLQIFDLCSGGR